MLLYYINAVSSILRTYCSSYLCYKLTPIPRHTTLGSANFSISPRNALLNHLANISEAVQLKLCTFCQERIHLITLKISWLSEFQSTEHHVESIYLLQILVPLSQMTCSSWSIKIDTWFWKAGRIPYLPEKGNESIIRQSILTNSSLHIKYKITSTETKRSRQNMSSTKFDEFQSSQVPRCEYIAFH